MASSGGLSEDRLAQEALLLATKADIREELDRLAPTSPRRGQLIAGADRSAASSISCHRNLTARRIPCAASPMPWT